MQMMGIVKIKKVMLRQKEKAISLLADQKQNERYKFKEKIIHCEEVSECKTDE